MPLGKFRKDIFLLKKPKDKYLKSKGLVNMPLEKFLKDILRLKKPKDKYLKAKGRV